MGKPPNLNHLRSLRLRARPRYRQSRKRVIRKVICAVSSGESFGYVNQSVVRCRFIYQSSTMPVRNSLTMMVAHPFMSYIDSAVTSLVNSSLATSETKRFLTVHHNGTLKMYFPVFNRSHPIGCFEALGELAGVWHPNRSSDFLDGKEC